MNTKLRLKGLKNIAPDYPRIPHLDKSISNMTHDDIQLESKVQFPITCWVQEKVDGANCGVSWTSGPVLRNRNNILKKGYIDKETPAKLQFRSAWNWLHDHGADIRKISNECMSPVTIYGEWLVAQHSMNYDKLPDWFLAYDIYSVEDVKFLAPSIVEDLLSKTDIKWIKSHKVTFNNINEIVQWSEKPSDYRNGVREGIVIKLDDGKFVTESFKVVNRHFVRREDFNEELIKNKIK
jgi:atypical dual specificity phosphatase